MLYHKNVYMPKGVKELEVKIVKFDYISKHAALKAKELGIDLSSCRIIFGGDEIVEIEMDEVGIISKMVIRMVKDEEFDKVYVICADIQKGVVLKTVWLNHKSDNHSTLDISKYEKEK